MIVEERELVPFAVLVILCRLGEDKTGGVAPDGRKLPVQVQQQVILPRHGHVG